MLDTIETATELPLDTTTKRERIEMELLKDAGRSDREIARIIGCDHKTVGAARERLGSSSPLGNSQEPPTPTERRRMLIEGCNDFDKRFPSASDGTAEEAVDNAIANGKVTLSPPGVAKEPEYDPFDPKDDAMVIAHQPAIAVYENPFGALVIRQPASAYDEQDAVVLVRPEHVEKLVAALRQAAKEAMGS